MRVLRRGPVPRVRCLWVLLAIRSVASWLLRGWVLRVLPYRLRWWVLWVLGVLLGRGRAAIGSGICLRGRGVPIGWLHGAGCVPLLRWVGARMAPASWRVVLLRRRVLRVLLAAGLLPLRPHAVLQHAMSPSAQHAALVAARAKAPGPPSTPAAVVLVPQLRLWLDVTVAHHWLLQEHKTGEEIVKNVCYHKLQ